MQSAICGFSSIAMEPLTDAAGAILRLPAVLSSHPAMQPLDIHRPLIDHYRRFFGPILFISRPPLPEPWLLPETFQIARFDPSDVAASRPQFELDTAAQSAANDGDPESDSGRDDQPNYRRLYAYATLGLSEAVVLPRLELFLLSPRADDSLAELLTTIALRHAAGERHLGVGHSVDLHRPWLDDSVCTRGLVSLPYLFGPAMEQGPRDAWGHSRSIFWLLPITPAEDAFKRTSGLEALEELFAATQISTADPNRSSVV